MKKQELIESYLNAPVKEGEVVWVKGLGSQDKNAWHQTASVVKVENNDIYIKPYYNSSNLQKVFYGDYKKYTGEIGANPFPKTNSRVQSINFSLDSVLFQLGLVEGREEKYEVGGIPIKSCNFNPFVFDKEGKKQYYQRPLVWELKDKQALIESIYLNVDCGKILIRNRGWKELEELVKKGETELYWKDCVDAKQRLHSIKDFLEDKFQDMHGNYFSDLSKEAQNKFTSHQLFGYAELPENSSDESVIEQFLKLNFAGVPQSTEHIEYVHNIAKLLKNEK